MYKNIYLSTFLLRKFLRFKLAKIQEKSEESVNFWSYNDFKGQRGNNE